MNGFEEQSNRQIIPRWLTFKSICTLSPHAATDYSWMSNLIDEESLQTKADDWDTSPSLTYAIDLVSSAYASGITNPSVHTAAKHIVKNRHAVSAVVVHVAISVLDSKEKHFHLESPTQPTVRAKIQGLKKASVEMGRDPFLQLDLAYNYTLLGQAEHALKRIKMALAYGDSNPWILRAIARYFLHTLKDPEQSLELLRGNPATKVNPLLMASEISISEAFELRSPFRSLGKKMIGNKNLHPSLLSELAATVGTFEHHSGSKKRAKEAFRLALVCPNENALAQAQWISEMLPIKFDPKNMQCMPQATYEAETIAQYRQEDYPKALKAAKNWVAFQPFTARPAIVASYISSVALRDYTDSIAMLETAIIASPESFTLRNNLAFSHASAGDADTAQDVLNCIDYSIVNSEDALVLSATQGLVEFRRGEIEIGRASYERAVQGFKSIKDQSREAMAKVFWAREEMIAATPLANEMAKDALVKAKKQGLKGLMVLDELEKSISQSKQASACESRK